MFASKALFNEPMGLSADANGNIYVADRSNNQIRMITPDRYVSLVAGSPRGFSGFKSGIGSQALFNSPNDVAADASGNIYVADMMNHSIRLIKGGICQVNTIAGNGIAGDSYGNGMKAQFNTPYGITVDTSGRGLINDSGNYKIKRLEKNLDVVKFSGSGVKGIQLGDASTCQYQDLKFADVDKSGNLWVIDMREDGHSRMLRVDGSGIPGIVKDFDQLTCAIGVALASTNYLYVAESVFEISQYSSSSSSSSSSVNDKGAKVTEDDNTRITENGYYLYHQ